jgi:hypothetical protein
MGHDDTKPDAPSHTPGTPRGEDLVKKHGGEAVGYQGNTRMGRDATGVNVDDRKPVDPRMPNLPPA